jgi:hypothetical protein
MSDPVSLSASELRHFGEKGYVVARDVVPTDLLAAATRAIDRLLGDDPPAASAIGQYYYWVGGLHAGPADDSSGIGIAGQGIPGRRDARASAQSGNGVRAALRDILHKTPVANLAKSLCAVPAMEVAFDQAQVALSIPHFLHRPGAGHIDGCEFNEHGQPGASVSWSAC